MKVAIETITPERAKKLLECSNGQNYRPLNMAYAKKYGDDIGNGVWQVNGESIKIRGHEPIGPVLDGQTRLMGCVLSGAPFRTVVVYGVDHAENIDTGRKRRYSDVLRARGYKYPSVLESVIRWIDEYDNSRGKRMATRKCATSIAECDLILAKHEHVHDVINLRSAKKVDSIARPSHIYGCMTVATRGGGLDLAAQFVDELVAGANLDAHNPVKMLRDRCLSQRNASVARMPKVVYAAIVVKAWNHWVAGERPAFLRWRPGGQQAEAFPVVLPAADFVFAENS